MIKSCYIHIPFCKNICSYCDFSKLFYNKEFVDKYLNSLENEINTTYKDDILDTIYIGGGTPSSLSLKELDRLFKILSKLKVNNNYEYTIECNFNTTTEEKLKLFKKYGINRLSFGIESINNNNLKLLERKENKKEIISIINLCRKLGFNNINVDLMYAIPGEGIDVLRSDLDFVLSLDIEHISTYSLILEENTKLYINNTNYISEDIDYDMYKLICDTLKNNNYIHYEISNFSKEGYVSRHNLCYWTNKEYYGFGLASSSYIGNKRINNTRNISKYFNNNYIIDYEELSIYDKMCYEMILGLRLINGINMKLFKEKYGSDINDIFDINELINKGLLMKKDGYIFIPSDKLYISNEILVNFIKE